MDRQDETLQGNEKIEVAIQALQKEATQEQLAHTLTVIRRRMKDSGQVIVAVDSVKSTFLVDIDKLFDAALTVPEIKGVILNPWNRTLMLDKGLIRIIKPE